MEQLNKKIIEKKASINAIVELPTAEMLELPVKVLQFGSGNFLRGFAEFFIDNANRKGIFNGRIAVVQSTASNKDTFKEQDFLYTLIEQGVQNGKPTEKFSVISSIKECLSAATDWKKVIDYAGSTEIAAIISNTTEVGIQLDASDDINSQPPRSFPGKLLAFLYERWKIFGNDNTKGVVILPCELLIDNGTKLKDILLQLAAIHQLPEAFMAWLTEANTFCNTLVDRIVPGLPANHAEISAQLGYTDQYITAAEFYRLWAIEGDEATLYHKLPFLQTDESIIIDTNITSYRERKLRILNGGHTIMVALGYLLGLKTVDECLNNKLMAAFLHRVIHEEICESLDLDFQTTHTFADDVLNRFRNPYLNHQLLAICLEYTTKMRMRNITTFGRYVRKKDNLPEMMCLGFAAYLLFSKPVRTENGKYFGDYNHTEYPINDSKAGYWWEVWQKIDIVNIDERTLYEFVKKICSNTALWEEDMSRYTKLVETVAFYLKSLIEKGAENTLTEVFAK